MALSVPSLPPLIEHHAVEAALDLLVRDAELRDLLRRTLTPLSRIAYKSAAEALSAPGELYRDPRGFPDAVYRLLVRGLHDPLSPGGEPEILYECLWPFRQFFVTPESEFLEAYLGVNP